MRLVYFFYTVLLLYFISGSQGQSCITLKSTEGQISESSYTPSVLKCWIIEVPKGYFMRIDVKSLNFSNHPCTKNYLKFFVAGMEESYTYCGTGTNRSSTFTAFHDVKITYYFDSAGTGKASFTLGYHRDDFKVPRTQAINWLKSHQKTNFGWGRDTHRAITALSLVDAAQFLGNKMDEEVMVKQLQAKMKLALLRNSTDPMSVSELSMYVNALTVTCHNDRDFFSNDLLKILADRAFSAASPSPGAYLTLCNANWSLTRSNVKTLLEPLQKDTEYQFHTEIKAMTILALSCIKDRTDLLSYSNDTAIFSSTVADLMKKQREDGSFGNPHTTGIVTQALIASGRTHSLRWNVTAALQFLINNLNSSSVDFLSVYLTLPLLKGKTLTDIGRVHCGDNYRKVDTDDKIVTTVDEGFNHIKVSLYIGDHKDDIHTLYLRVRVPENSTAFDVLNIAKVADPKYKFSYLMENGHVYIYKIAGISNDIETGKYWLFYSKSAHGIELKHHASSPDQMIIGRNEHLIVWYRTAHI